MLRCMMDKSLLNRFKDELQCKEPKRPKDSLWHQDKAMLLQAKENGAVLDTEVNHEDAYDSDVDDEPNAVAAFMANLSFSSSQINKVRTFNDNIFETVSPSWPSEVNHEDAYDSDVDDEPNAVAAFMANLSFSSSQINK
nr:hypothetical protein [Tanacetum cinerariifolium]